MAFYVFVIAGTIAGFVVFLQEGLGKIGNIQKQFNLERSHAGIHTLPN